MYNTYRKIYIEVLHSTHRVIAQAILLGIYPSLHQLRLFTESFKLQMTYEVQELVAANEVFRLWARDDVVQMRPDTDSRSYLTLLRLFALKRIPKS